MTVLAAVLAFGLGPPGADLLLPGGERLRFDVTVGGKTAEESWGEFLDAWFDYFDTDADGSVGPAEAARVVPLPGTGRPESAVDFAKLDANRDGKAGRAEWKAYHRGRGFTPVVATLEPPSAEARRLSDALVRALDTDGDGRLAREELASARRLLKTFDENEDDTMTAAEVLAAVPAAPGAVRSGVRLVAGGGLARVVRLAFDGAKPPAPQTVTDDGGRWAVAVRCGPAAIEPGETSRFYLGLFRAAAGESAEVSRQELEDDLAQRALLDVFGPADRDADGRLTRAELERFLGLVTQGASCQVSVVVADRGRNLFDALDADHDGRLDLRELGKAERAVAAGAVPLQVRVEVCRGTQSAALGPVRLARTKPAAEGAAPQAAGGPGWFRAMDGNGDGLVSPREFAGPPEAFRRLDRDGDGVIDAAEAEQARRD